MVSIAIRSSSSKSQTASSVLFIFKYGFAVALVCLSGLMLHFSSTLERNDGMWEIGVRASQENIDVSEAVQHFCNHSLECSLNGCFLDGQGCQCHKPWSGSSCSVLVTKPSPPSAKSLFPSPLEQMNSWSGPVHQDDEGRFHMYLAVYPKGNLAKASGLYYGKADMVTGPYHWKDLGVNHGANPGFVKYSNSTTGQTQYALFAGQRVWVEDKLNGSFNHSVAEYPHVNFSPIFHNGTFFGVFQATTFVYVNSNLRNRWGWERHGVIEAKKGKFKPTYLEDPHLWVDEYNHWHIIGHAFDKRQRYNCSNSMVSTHLFSLDGKEWHRSKEEPFGHTIHYTDGTSQVYATLERPYVVLDRQKRPSHIILAAALEHGDEGCAHTEDCKKKERFCSCVNCKWLGLAGTVVLSLDIP